MRAQIDRVRFLRVGAATPICVPINQHAAIAAAGKAGDPVRAEVAVRVQLTEILRSLPQLAARHPELFENAAA